MAIAYVKQIDKQTNNNTLTVPAGGVAQGNFIIVMFAGSGAVSSLTGVSDSRSNSYAIDIPRGHTGDTALAVIASASVTTALLQSDTIVLATPSNSRVIGAWEFSGVGGGLDQTAAGDGLGTAVATNATAALASAADLYVAVIRTLSGPLTDTTSGLTSLGDDFDQYHFRYKLLGASTAVDYQGTVGSTDWAAAVATYNPVAATVASWRSPLGSKAPVKRAP